MDNGDDDAEKYARLKAELDAEDGLTPTETQPPIEEGVEPYDADRHGDGVVDHYRQYLDQQSGGADYPSGYGQPAELPDVLDDPIGHFNARVGQIENAVASGGAGGFWDHVQRSEQNARHELDDEYDRACAHLEQGRMRELERQYPDNHQVAVLAHKFGLASPAELRTAVLNQERVAIASHALQNGIDPASAYYHLAQERGYRPRRAFSKSEMRTLSDAMDRADGADFDRLWRDYERRMKRVERR